MPDREPPYDQAARAFGEEPGTDGDEASARFGRGTGILFEQAMAQTRMAVCLSDPNAPDMPIVFANRAFRELTGYSDDEIIGRNCRFLQGEDTDPASVERIRRALKAENTAVVELLNYRKDGTPFWNALHLGPIYDPEGKLLYIFGSQWDVTEVHSARTEQRHADLMASELSHRIKNIFAVMAGIVNMVGRKFDARDVTDRIATAIHALGRAHEPTFGETATTGDIDIAPSIRAVLAPHGDGRVGATGPEVRTSPAIVSTLGLVLNELAANAVKHGALKVLDGRVDVTWGEQDGYLVVDWRETGGPAVQAAPGGNGTQIIDRLLAGMGSRIDRDWDPEGLHARILLQLPRQA
ncbi:PAS domain-containing protein [Wenxinia saemankumensis]|uniref:histidine kinase n=1 Tax=Wenxinia saemankumensis TaxID=1447782 RepID=A0A1M6B0C6_9RHOB|nr:PAS domain-containing protein [Wenxinia saemankumensis]SHI42162.1 PAS domain S-box-containing protein [Wenxinia saemankumensis]